MLILSAKRKDFPHTIINAHFLGVPVNSRCTCLHAMAARPQILITEIPGLFVFKLLLGLRSRSGNQSTEMWPPHLVNLAISCLLQHLGGCVCSTQQGQACTHTWNMCTSRFPQHSGQEASLLLCILKSQACPFLRTSCVLTPARFSVNGLL